MKKLLRLLNWNTPMSDNFEHGEFEAQYLATPSKESIEKQERAFNARLAYEKNCIAKYDYPDLMMKSSRPIPKGERMEDFAYKFGADIKEMRKHGCEFAVERWLANSINRSKRRMK